MEILANRANVNELGRAKDSRMKDPQTQETFKALLEINLKDVEIYKAKEKAQTEEKVVIIKKEISNKEFTMEDIAEADMILQQRGQIVLQQRQRSNGRGNLKRNRDINYNLAIEPERSLIKKFKGNGGNSVNIKKAVETVNYVFEEKLRNEKRELKRIFTEKIDILQKEKLYELKKSEIQMGEMEMRLITQQKELYEVERAQIGQKQLEQKTLVKESNKKEAQGNILFRKQKFKEQDKTSPIAEEDLLRIAKIEGDLFRERDARRNIENKSIMLQDNSQRALDEEKTQRKQLEEQNEQLKDAIARTVDGQKMLLKAKDTVLKEKKELELQFKKDMENLTEKNETNIGGLTLRFEKEVKLLTNRNSDLESILQGNKLEQQKMLKMMQDKSETAQRDLKEKMEYAELQVVLAEDTIKVLKQEVEKKKIDALAFEQERKNLTTEISNGRENRTYDKDKMLLAERTHQQQLKEIESYAKQKEEDLANMEARIRAGEIEQNLMQQYRHELAIGGQNLATELKKIANERSQYENAIIQSYNEVQRLQTQTLQKDHQLGEMVRIHNQAIHSLEEANSNLKTEVNSLTIHKMKIEKMLDTVFSKHMQIFNLEMDKIEMQQLEPIAVDQMMQVIHQKHMDAMFNESEHKLKEMEIQFRQDKKKSEQLWERKHDETLMRMQILEEEKETISSQLKESKKRAEDISKMVEKREADFEAKTLVAEQKTRKLNEELELKTRETLHYIEQLNSAKSEYENTKAQHERLAQNKADWGDRLGHMNLDIERANNEKEDLQNQISNLMRGNVELQEEFERRLKGLKDVENQWESSDTMNVVLIEEQANVIVELNKQIDELNTLNQLKVAHGDNMDGDGPNRDLKIHGLEMNIEDLKLELRENEERFGQYKRQLKAEMNKSYPKIIQFAEQVQDTNLKAEFRIAELEARLNEVMNEGKNFMAQATDALKKLRELEPIVELYRKKLEQKESDILSLNLKIKQLNEELKMANAKIATLEVTLLEKEKNIGQMKLEIAQIKGDNKMLRNEIIKMKNIDKKIETIVEYIQVPEEKKEMFNQKVAPWLLRSKCTTSGNKKGVISNTGRCMAINSLKNLFKNH